MGRKAYDRDRSRPHTARLIGWSARVPCHFDIHAGNVLLGSNGALSIVEWDTLTMVPKVRDLMFVGAGVSGVWNEPEEVRLFFKGYGLEPGQCRRALLLPLREDVLVNRCVVFIDGRRDLPFVDKSRFAFKTG